MTRNRIVWGWYLDSIDAYGCRNICRPRAASGSFQISTLLNGYTAHQTAARTHNASGWVSCQPQVEPAHDGSVALLLAPFYPTQSASCSPVTGTEDSEDSTHSRTDLPDPPSTQTRATRPGTAVDGILSFLSAEYPPPCASARSETRRPSQRTRAREGLRMNSNASSHQLTIKIKHR